MSTSSSEDDDVLLAAASIVVMKFKKKKKNANNYYEWQNSNEIESTRYSGSHILRELSTDDIGGFKNFTRLTPKMFTKLLDLVKPIVEKKETTFRKAIPAN